MTEIGTATSVPYEEDGQTVRKPGSIGVPLQDITMKVAYTL